MQPQPMTADRRCWNSRHRTAPPAYDKHVYKERHLVECFFNKIKHFHVRGARGEIVENAVDVRCDHGVEPALKVEVLA